MKTVSFFDRTPIRWGVIGCGDVAEKKSVPAYQNIDGFQVHSVMRRNQKKVEDYALRHQIPNYTTNALELINNPDIDAVYIATPPDTHKLYALQVAEAGKPCCIEKPMSPCYQDSLQIYRAFKEKEIPLFIAYYRRSLPRFLKVKEWLDTNEIGDVRHIQWIKNGTPSEKDINGAYNWRTDAKIAPAGYFDDLASHGLDLFTFLLGNISDAKGFPLNQQGLYTAYDAVVGSWVHESGITGGGSWNFGCAHREDKVEIYGSRGNITFSVLDENPVRLENDNGKVELTIEHPRHVQQYHVENIKKHLLGEAIHPSLGDSGLHTSWVMDNILGTL